MKQIALLLFAQLVFTAAFSQSNADSRQLKRITVSGSGYERGYQHGQQLKKEIGELMVLWKKDLQGYDNMPADSFLQQFLTATNFLPSVKKYTPDILEEVRGIAEGSGQAFNDIFAFQLVDEYWVYMDKRSNDPSRHHCSSMGVPARHGKPAYVAQNMDLETFMDGYQMVLHVEQNDRTPEQYIFTCPGLVALNGINACGIGVCVNTLMQLGASTDGLPVAFMIRGLLAQKKGKKCLQFLQATKHASGQNYLVGTVDSVYDFEASAQKVVRMYPDASGLVYHTNNPVVNNDIKPWYSDYYKRFLAGNTNHQNSEIRFVSLQTRAAQTIDKDVAFLKTTLRSKDDPTNPVCRAHVPDKGGFTFGSVILTLSGERSMQVTAGPPDESEYQVFYFGK